jgi:hypothetical protein
MVAAMALMALRPSTVSLLNFIKIYQLVKKLIGWANTHTDTRAGL